jgi:hypothetical protein
MTTEEIEKALSQLADVIANLQGHVLATQDVIKEHLEMHNESLGTKHGLS